jgi:hypothetical protein
MLASPVHQRPPIPPINPKSAQLFTGAAKPGAEETGPGGV